MSSSKQMKFSGAKAVGVSILAICLLAFSQLLALLIGNMLVAGGMSAVTGNIFTGIFYAGLVLGEVFLICKKMLKIPMADFKIRKPDLYPFWIIAAFVMPLFVILVYQLFAGSWQQSSLEPETLKQLVSGSVTYLGLAAGIVEETVFRGVIMSSVEYAWNRKIAVIVPSVLFGCLHIEEGMSISGMVQVVIAGSLVGILFSLVTCYTGTIWYSALMHGIWNCLMIGGIVHIGSSADSTVYLCAGYRLFPADRRGFRCGIFCYFHSSVSDFCRDRIFITAEKERSVNYAIILNGKTQS